MAGRPTTKKANIQKIQQLIKNSDGIVDYRPIIAAIMRYCGCTYTEIGEAFGITRQMAQTVIKATERIDE